MCPIANQEGWSTERTAKWSTADRNGIDFRMVAPNGKVYLLDLCMKLDRKVGRYWKETNAVATADMVRNYLKADADNLLQFLDQAALLWQRLRHA